MDIWVSRTFLIERRGADATFQTQAQQGPDGLCDPWFPLSFAGSHTKMVNLGAEGCAMFSLSLGDGRPEVIEKCLLTFEPQPKPGVKVGKG